MTAAEADAALAAGSLGAAGPRGSSRLCRTAGSSSRPSPKISAIKQQAFRRAGSSGGADGASSPPTLRRSRSPRSPAPCQRPDRVVGAPLLQSGAAACRWWRWSAATPPPAHAGRGARTCRMRGARPPVTAADTPGFIVNRDRPALLRRGAPDPRRGHRRQRHHRLGDEGARRIQDGALRADGPDRQRHQLRGHPVGLRSLSTTIRAISPPSPSERLVEANLLGRKTGRGYYDYRDGAVLPAADTNDPALGRAIVGPHPRDADQRGGRRGVLARRHAGRHRPRDDQGRRTTPRDCSSGPTRSGYRSCCGRLATPAGGVRRGSLPAEPAAPPHGPRRNPVLPVTDTEHAGRAGGGRHARAATGSAAGSASRSSS